MARADKAEVFGSEGHQMNIVKPYAQIVTFDDEGTLCTFGRRHGIGLLRKIEYMGRISHRAEEQQTNSSWQRFIQGVVIGHGDWSIVEHASVSVDFVVDRGITHEFVRHRLFSFTQESTRFVNYEKKMPPSFIMPGGLSDGAERAGNGEQTGLSQAQMWRHAVDTVESMYRDLVRSGCTPQLARSVFPNALAARIAITGNLRVWRHFLIMRTTKETHPQAREVTIPLLQDFKDTIPLLFDDIKPENRQAENLKLPR